MTKRIHGRGLEGGAADRWDVALDTLDTQALEALRGALVQPLDVLRQTAEQVAAAKGKLVDLGLNGRGLIAGGTRVLDNGGLEALDVVGKFALALLAAASASRASGRSNSMRSRRLARLESSSSRSRIAR